MIVEVEIEDVGLNACQVHRARRVKGSTSSLVLAVFSCGLPVEKQQPHPYAHRFMTSARTSPGRQGPVTIGHLLKLVSQWNRAAA